VGPIGGRVVAGVGFDEFACGVDVGDGEESVVADEQYVFADGDDVGPVEGGVVAHVGFDEFACAVDVGDREQSVVANK